MKLIILSILVLYSAIIKAQNELAAPPMLGSSAQNAGRENKKQFAQIQQSVSTLLAASKAKPGPNSDIHYFWDLLSPLTQFVLLNQSQVLALQFNVTEKVSQNVSNLNWDLLPENVRAYLLTHEASQLLYMPFSQWGWTDSKNLFAPSTLFSLMTKKDQMIVPNVLAMIAPIHFNLPIDLYYLNDSLNHDIYFNYNGGRFFQNDYLVGKYFDSLFVYFHNWFDQALVPQNMLRFRRQSANSIFSQAMYRAESFIIRRYIARKK